MEVLSTLLTIVSVVLLIIKFATRMAPQPKDDFMITANLKVPEPTIAELGIGQGEAVTLKADPGKLVINVLASGTSWTPTNIGTISDMELYRRVTQNGAQGKIYAINGDVVTIEFKYL